MKKLAMILLIIPQISWAEVLIGPAISFLSTPHPWNLSLNLKHKKTLGYISIGSYRSLEYEEEPISMRNQAIGLNYLWTKGFYTGVEAGHQKVYVVYSDSEITNFYAYPKIGYEFSFKETHLFIQTEVGWQVNFNEKTKGSDLTDIKTLEHFGKDSLLNFTLFKIGYYF